MQVNILHDSVGAIGSTPYDSFSLMNLTPISAIGNAEKQVHLTHAYFAPPTRARAAH